jgi:hypothetical protein
MKLVFNDPRMFAGAQDRWVDVIDEEDLAFIKRFVLCSGSLKELAEAYCVSYPTVRLRLDRVIQKIRILEDMQVKDAYERLLRAQYADGKLETETFKRLLAAYQQQKKGDL